MASHNYHTFRVRGIPELVEKRDVRNLIRKALGLASDARLRIHSLATNHYRKSQTATVTFQKTPEFLTKTFGFDHERTFAVPFGDGDRVSDSDSQDSDAISLAFDDHFHGFTPVHTLSGELLKIDIVAVSGLGGHAFGSFKERKGSFMWLRDLLPGDMPTARILIYGYDTSLESSQSFQSLTDLGRNFHLGLKNIRVARRPIIIICHSLGGLVVKEALISMKYTNGPEDREILENICGVLAFGVPSQGMSVSSLIAIVGDQPNRALLETLKSNSPLLQRQQRELSHMFEGMVSPPFLAFYETRESPTACILDGEWKLAGPPAVLVEVASATQGCVEIFPVDRSHSDLVKLGKWDEELYQTILRAISYYLLRNAILTRRRSIIEHLKNEPRLEYGSNGAAILAMIYLPFSFAASCFGGGILVFDNFWIYVYVAVPLTSITGGVLWWMASQQHKARRGNMEMHHYKRN